MKSFKEKNILKLFWAKAKLRKVETFMVSISLENSFRNSLHKVAKYYKMIKSRYKYGNMYKENFSKVKYIHVKLFGGGVAQPFEICSLNQV